MASICTMAWVYGSVQGVGFRYSTQREALQLGVTGYARNLDDGGVEVLACGEAEQVEKLITWLKAGGPRSARVDRVLTEPHQPTRSWDKFAILDQMHFTGFGKPAISVACLAGPFGNRR